LENLNDSGEEVRFPRGGIAKRHEASLGAKCVRAHVRAIDLARARARASERASERATERAVERVSEWMDGRADQGFGTVAN